MSVERVYLQCIVYVNRYLWFTCNVKGRNHFHFYILYQLKKKELLAICQSSVFNWTKVRTHQRLSRSFILQTLLCIVRFLKQRFPSMQQSNKRELQYIAVHFSTCSSLWQVRVKINPISYPKGLKKQGMCSPRLLVVVCPEVLCPIHGSIIQSLLAQASVCPSAPVCLGDRITWKAWAK